MKKIQRRYVDTDVMRIIASFGVVLLHAATYTSGIGLSDKGISQIINIFCRFSVPVFVMISGRYMLTEKRSVLSVWVKTLKVFAILILTSAAYAAYEYIVGGYFNGFSAAVAKIFTEPVHLWYLYMIMCLYIFTPVLYVFTKNANKETMIYCIFLCFMFGSVIYIPVHSAGFEILKSVIEKCKIDTTLGFVGCYLFGFYVQKFGMSKNSRIILYILGAAGVIATILADSYMNFSDDADRGLLISFFSPCILFFGAAAYVGIKSFLCYHPARRGIAAAVNDAAQCTFGIYLWHVLAIKIMTRGITHQMGTITIFLMSIAVYVICYIVTRIFKGMEESFHRKVSNK